MGVILHWVRVGEPLSANHPLSPSTKAKSNPFTRIMSFIFSFWHDDTSQSAVFIQTGQEITQTVYKSCDLLHCLKMRLGADPVRMHDCSAKSTVQIMEWYRHQAFHDCFYMQLNPPLCVWPLAAYDPSWRWHQMAPFFYKNDSLHVVLLIFDILRHLQWQNASTHYDKCKTTFKLKQEVVF